MNAMKIVVGGCLMLGAVTAFADLFCAEVTTEGVKDDDGSYASCYAAYLCTTEAAKTYFGGNSSVDDITSWLAESGANYTRGMTAIKDGEDKSMFKENYWYYLGAYSFVWDAKPAFDGDYIAVIAYENGDDNQFRVFGGEADKGDGTLTIDPGTGFGTAGDWSPASVPEPTSGLLLLLGVAGLALKRKRA